MNNFLVKDENGKPVFVGREDPTNPPVDPQKGAQIECGSCHTLVDSVIGSQMACNACYDPDKDQKDTTGDTYDATKEMI